MTSDETAMPTATATPTAATATQVERRLEAILMVVDEPQSVIALAAAAGAPVPAVRAALATLCADFDGEASGPRRGFELREVGGGWRIYVRAEHDTLVTDFVTTQTPSRLSQAALETLAVVAYKQPITRIEVDDIRGVNSSGAISKLQAFDLIRENGKKEVLGRPNLYVTTDYFLDYMGINSLEELPDVSDLEIVQEETELFLERNELENEN